MTIRHLKLFVEVYKMLNITKAAENLHMTQPTVTRAIQELEDHYQVKLFDRINHKIQPTEAGSRFYRYAAKTMELLDDIETGMRDWDESGVINIGATLSIGSTILPRLIKEYKELHPNVTIKSTISNSVNLQNALETNELDFALIEGFSPANYFCCEAFSVDKLIVLLPPNDPRSEKKVVPLEEIQSGPFLMREKGSEGRAFVDALFKPHGLPPEPLMESVSTHALVQAVHAGIGIAILPESLVRHGVESGFVSTCTIQGVEFARKNYIVWHEGKYLSATAKAMMQLCKEIAAR